MKTSTFPLLLLMLFSSWVKAQTITWSEHAAPIIYNNCVKCHNPNGVAPFELLTAESAIANKEGIKYMVSNRLMPPWTPDPHYRRFASERILSQDEIDTLVNWVNSGAVKGDISKAPAVPQLSGASQIVNEDLKIKIPNYTVNTPQGDHYRCFVVPYSIITDKYITDIEVLPGNRKAVHHVLLFHDSTTVPETLDAMDVEPGYPCFGSTGSRSSELIGGWVPGQEAQHMPQGIGLKLPANAKTVIQVHYPIGTTNAIDSTKVLLKFSNKPLRSMAINPFLNHVESISDGPLFIPAQTVKTFHASFTVPIDVSLVQIAPHMHLVGKSMKVWGVTQSQDTIPLIDIPAWNFHWQGFYNFRNLLKIPAGTTIYNETVYDNTHNNHHNPAHGMNDVKLGEATTDEMMLVYFSYLPYRAADESITNTSGPAKVLGIHNSTKSALVSGHQLYDLSPNPATDAVKASFYLPVSSSVKVEVTNLLGKAVPSLTREQVFLAGHQSLQISTGNLLPGKYLLSVTTSSGVKTKSFIKQ